MSPEQIVLGGIPAMAVIVGIVQVFKQAGLPSRFAGVVALLLGLTFGGLAGLTGGDTPIYVDVSQGLMAGLGASGAWSMGSNAANGMLKRDSKPKRRGLRR